MTWNCAVCGCEITDIMNVFLNQAGEYVCKKHENNFICDNCKRVVGGPVVNISEFPRRFPYGHYCEDCFCVN